MPALPALSARDLGFRHGRGGWLFEGLTLDVAPGGLLRVRGGNGAGKSTLLRVLAGTVAPRRGRVHRAGPVAHLPQQTGDPPAVDPHRLVELVSGRVWSSPGGWSAARFLVTAGLLAVTLRCRRRR